MPTMPTTSTKRAPYALGERCRAAKRRAFDRHRPAAAGRACEGRQSLAFRPGISEAFIFVKPKHFLPRSFSDAPKRETRPRARRHAAGAGRIGRATARERCGR